jgi:hypothetical protein
MNLPPAEFAEMERRGRVQAGGTRGTGVDSRDRGACNRSDGSPQELVIAPIPPFQLGLFAFCISWGANFRLFSRFSIGFRRALADTEQKSS